MKESLIHYQVLCAIGTVAIVIVGLWLLVGLRRRQDLAAAGRWLGLTFSCRIDPELTATLREMRLFGSSHSERAYNVLQGLSEGIEWRVSDYYYATGGGKNQRGYTQTIAVCRAAIPLPDFTVAAEYFYHRLFAKFGSRDITFPAFPTFSRRYRVCAADETALRRLFSPDIIRFFEQRNRTIHVASRAGRLAIYYPRRCISGQALRAFLEMATELAQRLVKAQQAAAAEGRA